jgi:hypothetical protein
MRWFTVVRGQFMFPGSGKDSFVFGKAFPYPPLNRRRGILRQNLDWISSSCMWTSSALPCSFLPQLIEFVFPCHLLEISTPHIASQLCYMSKVLIFPTYMESSNRIPNPRQGGVWTLHIQQHHVQMIPSTCYGKIKPSLERGFFWSRENMLW